MQFAFVKLVLKELGHKLSSAGLQRGGVLELSWPQAARELDSVFRIFGKLELEKWAKILILELKYCS